MNRRIFLSSLIASSIATIFAPFLPKPKKLEEIKQIPVKQDRHNYKLGWVVYESLGVVIINDYAIARVTVE